MQVFSQLTQFGIYSLVGGIAGLAVGTFLYRKLDGGNGDYMASKTINGIISVSSAAIVLGILLLLENF